MKYINDEAKGAGMADKPAFIDLRLGLPLSGLITHMTKGRECYPDEKKNK